MLKHAQKGGFTIVELLIVIVVIGILAGIVVVSYRGIQEKAKKLQYQSMVRDVQKHVKSFYAINGYYPDGDELDLNQETKKHFKNHSLMYTADKKKYWKKKGIFYSGHSPFISLNQCYNGLPNLSNQDSPIFILYYDMERDQIVKEIFGCDKDPSKEDGVLNYTSYNIHVKYSE